MHPDKISKISLKTLLRAILVLGTIAAFIHLLLVSETGFRVHSMYKKEIESQKQEIVSLNLELASINQEIAQWESDDFYLEKMMREELLMGSAQERVYILQ